MLLTFYDQLPVKLDLFRTFGAEVAKLRSSPLARLVPPESTRFFGPDDLDLAGASVSEGEPIIPLNVAADVAGDLKLKTEEAGI